MRITHKWVERSASRPPAAPPAPLFPTDGGEAVPRLSPVQRRGNAPQGQGAGPRARRRGSPGTDFAFRWTPPEDPDGDPIRDYQFELSDRPDMQWPLSTNFYRLISKIADRGQSRYTLPHPGLLTPNRQYYWRVRACDAQGVWGPWSATWSFTPRAPSPPVDVTLTVDPRPGTGILSWKPNPEGRKPLRYRIYGSDEKGFSVSDKPYTITAGVSRDVPSAQPANFVAETAATQANVIGPELHLPNANRAYYRVVAVDDHGNRSSPSDFAEAPRPFLYSRPLTTAQVGTRYRCSVFTLHSLGDLRTRVIDGKETMSFWEVEAPRFDLRQAPPWLELDPVTGLLSGTPDRPGEFPVVVTATLERENRTLDAQGLSWGIEKVLSTGTQRVGVATQKFTIKVAR